MSQFTDTVFDMLQDLKQVRYNMSQFTDNVFDMLQDLNQVRYNMSQFTDNVFDAPGYKASAIQHVTIYW